MAKNVKDLGWTISNMKIYIINRFTTYFCRFFCVA